MFIQIFALNGGCITHFGRRRYIDLAGFFAGDAMGMTPYGKVLGWGLEGGLPEAKVTI